VLVVATLVAGRAVADQQPQPKGFAVERFYPSAPQAGWLVMDSLDMHGGLGGAMAMTLGYAANPLRVSDGMSHLAVVSDQAFADFGVEATYHRWRWYANVAMPLAIYGQSGSVGGYAFKGPAVNLGANPDTLSDPRLGANVRIVGEAYGRFRFGLDGQLIIPSGERSEYDTDGTYRGMVRALFAGDAGLFTWAAQLGVHIRPLDEPTPGSPRGSELLFGVAGGVKLPVGRAKQWAMVLGPELYGASAFKAFFTADGTALELLASGRLEGTRHDRWQVRIKLGVGGGLHQQMGASEWRLVAGVEMFNHRAR
jgi:hypothetical protein